MDTDSHGFLRIFTDFYGFLRISRYRIIRDSRLSTEFYGILRNSTEGYWWIRRDTDFYGSVRIRTDPYGGNTDFYGFLRILTDSKECYKNVFRYRWNQMVCDFRYVCIRTGLRLKSITPCVITFQQKKIRGEQNSFDRKNSIRNAGCPWSVATPTR